MHGPPCRRHAREFPPVGADHRALDHDRVSLRHHALDPILDVWKSREDGGMDRVHAARITFCSDRITEAHVLGQVGLDRIRIVVGGQL